MQRVENMSVAPFPIAPHPGFNTAMTLSLGSEPTQSSVPDTSPDDTTSIQSGVIRVTDLDTDREDAGIDADDIPEDDRDSKFKI